MATITVNPRLTSEEVKLIDRAWSLLEGISEIAASYEDGGRYSGMTGETSEYRHLAEMAVDQLYRLKFGVDGAVGA